MGYARDLWVNPELRAYRDSLVDKLDLSAVTVFSSKNDPDLTVVIHPTVRSDAPPDTVQVTYHKRGKPIGHFFTKNNAGAIKRSWARLGPLILDSVYKTKGAV